jgi:hypothetical protein
MGWLAVEVTLGNFFYSWWRSIHLSNKREERRKGCTVHSIRVALVGFLPGPPSWINRSLLWAED